MKSLLVGLISIVSVAASADDSACFKELCRGDWVRNTQGWQAVVTGFDSILEEVRVEMAETGAPWKFQYAELGKSVRCHQQFCVGDPVVDSHQNSGKVEEVYTNDLVYVYAFDFDGYFLYHASELRHPN